MIKKLLVILVVIVVGFFGCNLVQMVIAPNEEHFAAEEVQQQEDTVSEEVQILAQYFVGSVDVELDGTYFREQDLERIQGSTITVYSNNEVVFYGWPDDTKNVFEYEESQKCVSRNCIEFSRGFSDGDTTASISRVHTFLIDMNELTMYFTYQSHVSRRRNDNPSNFQWDTNTESVYIDLTE